MKRGLSTDTDNHYLIKKIIRENYEQLHYNEFENLDEIDKFLKTKH